MTSYLVNARTSSRKSNRIVPGLVMALLLPGCAAVDIYNMQGMEGTVVDKATGEPIEGVMVIEVWEAGGGFEGHTVDYLPLQEAVTDRNGRYEFPARGTKHVEEGFLTADSPRLIFFRPGYIFKSESNRYHPDRRFEFNRRSDWHRKTVELEKFEGTLTQQAKELERFSSVLGNLTGPRGQCIWTEIPNTLWAVYQEHKRLLKQGMLARVAIGASDRRKRLSECPSSEGFRKVFANEIN